MRPPNTEMTLDEFVEILHPNHKARVELDLYKTQLLKLTDALNRISTGWTIMENDELSDIAKSALESIKPTSTSPPTEDI